MNAPAVAATPFMKSRRVILRCIPSSRSRESCTIFSQISVTQSNHAGTAGTGCPAEQSRPLLRTALFGFLDCQFGSLESDLAVGSIAEGLVDRAAAATE